MSQAPAKAASLFVSTGELSGDMHAAHLVVALNKLRTEQGLPAARISANGSARLLDAGADLMFDVADWGEMGIIANLLKGRHMLRAIRTTARHILSNQPDMVVLVDSRFFNTNLAKLIRQGGYAGKIIYYVSPVRWESCYDPAENERSLLNSRFTLLKEYCDFCLPIYPVSLPVYEQLSIPHEFPGHPLCELAKPRLSDAGFSELTGIHYDSAAPPLIVGAMLGSRLGELKYIAPEILRSLAILKEAFAADPALPAMHVVAPVAHPELQPRILTAARQAGLEDLVLIEPEHTFDLMHRARLMIVKSGTGLHEAMLCNVPAMMCYRVAPLVGWVARHLQRFSMPFYGLPNLLAGREIIPELIQHDCNRLQLAEVAGRLIHDDSARADMLAGYAEVRQKVCKPGSLQKSATIIQELLPN